MATQPVVHAVHGAIAAVVLALAAAAYTWPMMAALVSALGIATLATFYVQCTRTGATSSSAIQLPTNWHAIDTDWMTLAFQESGLLTLEQRVVGVEFSDVHHGHSAKGIYLLRAHLKYAGPGDLSALPKRAMIKFADVRECAAAKLCNDSAVYLSRVVYTGGHMVDDTRREHALYRYLNSDLVRKEPWALKAPEIYFEGTMNLPVETPSAAAVCFFGAWVGTRTPRAHSILVMEDLFESGLHMPPGKVAPSGDCFICSLTLVEVKDLILEPLARWHAAQWGCRDAAARALPLTCKGVTERSKDFWSLMWWKWGTLSALWRLRMRRTPAGQTQFADAVQHALETVYRPKKMMRITSELDRPGVAAALRGLERAYGPALVPFIRERIVSGTIASKNMTVLHGDVHFLNVMLSKKQEADPDVVTYADAHFYDFQNAGRGHVVHDMLNFMTMGYDGAPRTPAIPFLKAYHAALAKALPASVSYSLDELLEDWSLAVAEKACENLVVCSIPILVTTQDVHARRRLCRVFAMLEEVMLSDTKVGAVLRRAAEWQGGAAAPPQPVAPKAEAKGAGKGKDWQGGKQPAASGAAAPSQPPAKAKAGDAGKGQVANAGGAGKGQPAKAGGAGKGEPAKAGGAGKGQQAKAGGAGKGQPVGKAGGAPPVAKAAPAEAAGAPGGDGQPAGETSAAPAVAEALAAEAAGAGTGQSAGEASAAPPSDEA